MISGRSHIQSCEAVIGTVQSSFQWYCVEASPGRPSILDSTRLTQWKNQFGQQIFGCVYDVCPSFVIPTCVRADYRSVTNAKGLSVDIPAPAVYVSGAVKKLSRRRWAASHDRGRCG